MKKVLKGLIIFFIILIFTITGSKIIYAAENNSLKIEIVEKSEDFKKWENLSEEERKNTIQPLYNTVSINNYAKRLPYNFMIKTASTGETLEQTYDLRKNLTNIIVKDQKSTGSCWAFSYTSALETTVSKKTNTVSKEYSPMHMDYVTSKIFNRKVGDGGNPLVALAYSASTYGPIYESDLPFNSVYDQTKNRDNQYYLTDIENVNLNQVLRARVEDATLFASIYKTYEESEVKYKDSHDMADAKEYTEEQVTEIRNSIKNQIKQDGAITSVLYSDIQEFDNGKYESSEGYFNSEHNAYYCNNSSVLANHAVTIVGWDDTFKTENFNAEHRPLHDGAYIVLNSYGSSFGENGYFYVSYDDVCIEQMMVGIDSITENVNPNNQRIYEHDELGMSTELEVSANLMYVANVFTRPNTNDIETLSEIGLFLYESEGVEVYIVPELTNINNLGNPVISYTGSNSLEAGYHTLKLTTPIELKQNKFAVVVKYVSSGNVYIPVECNLKANGLTSQETYWDTAVSNVGESYIYNGGQWQDLYNLNVLGSNLTNTNLCIKAFTTYTKATSSVKVTEVTLEQKNLTMYTQDTVTLKVTINPTNAANKKVTWKSSNQNVATVSDEGVITAVGEGNTIITVTTVDGNFSDSCTLTVIGRKIEDQNPSGNGTDEQINVGTKDEKQLDGTISNNNLPYTGIEIKIILFVISVFGLIIIYRKYKTFKDIK